IGIELQTLGHTVIELETARDIVDVAIDDSRIVLRRGSSHFDSGPLADFSRNCRGKHLVNVGAVHSSGQHQIVSDGYAARNGSAEDGKESGVAAIDPNRSHALSDL